MRIIDRHLAAFLAVAMLALSGIRSPAQESAVQVILRARFPPSGAAPRLGPDVYRRDDELSRLLGRGAG